MGRFSNLTFDLYVGAGTYYLSYGAQYGSQMTELFVKGSCQN